MHYKGHGFISAYNNHRRFPFPTAHSIRTQHESDIRDIFAVTDEAVVDMLEDFVRPLLEELEGDENLMDCIHVAIQLPNTVQEMKAGAHVIKTAYHIGSDKHATKYRADVRLNFTTGMTDKLYGSVAHSFNEDLENLVYTYGRRYEDTMDRLNSLQATVSAINEEAELMGGLSVGQLMNLAGIVDAQKQMYIRARDLDCY
jgi:hypothetical protein